MIWLKFIICLGIILFAGTQLARYGDAIAEKTRLGRIWIGLVVIAVITTMPEMVTSISSVALVQSPDLALGTLLGSCGFNLGILAVLDVLHSRTPVLTAASPRHAATGGWGALLIAIAAAGIILGRQYAFLDAGWVGMPSIVIIVLYLLGMWWVFRRERGQRLQASPTAETQYDNLTSRGVWLRFALAAAAVIAAGIWLSFIGDEISRTTGWGGTFVGTLFLAVATSAPELVVAIAALRMGAVDLAVADVLGANMLNMAMIAPVDLAHGRGFVLSSVSSNHLIAASVAVMMSLLVVVGLRFPQRRKVLKVASWYAPVLIALYIGGAYVLFNAGAGL
ncbi:MAG: sodium:calcium antiporter [Dehalococcoidia bacterium]|nr:sodium:calcium antiporter [Dehalococcoidia bacterium]